MQIVIDIPEDIKAIIDRYGTSEFVAEMLWQAVKNGTPHETITEFADRCRECGREKVLNKIRAEIISLTDGDTPERIWNVDVLEIIDKYEKEQKGERL